MGWTCPSPNAGSSRPPDIVARLASALASRIGLRPGSTITLIPNFRFVVRPAPYAIATIGSGASPVIRSETHKLSNDQPFEFVDHMAEAFVVQGRARAEAETDANLHGPRSWHTSVDAQPIGWRSGITVTRGSRRDLDLAGDSARLDPTRREIR